MKLSVIGRKLARAHAYAFYVIRGTFQWTWDDGLQDWKALLFISVAMSFAVFSGVTAVSIALQHRMLLPDAKQRFMTLWRTVTVGLTAINYWNLVRRRRWSRFERDFRHVSKGKRLALGAVVWASVILIVGVAEWMAFLTRKLPG